MTEEKKPPPGSDMNVQTFPDLDTAPGKRRIVKSTPEEIADAKAEFQRRAGNPK